MPAVNLLGTPGISLGDEQAAVPQGKTSALLYYLAYQDDWVSREDLLYLFWPDTGEQKARRNLRQLLSTIRALSFTSDLETTHRHLRWPVPSDARAFREAVAEEVWGRAATCYRGSLLYGFRSPDLPEFESWLELERASLFGQYRTAVFKLSEHLEREERYARAAQCLGRLHQFEPFDEDVLQRYVRQLGLADKRSEALSVFECFCKTLTLELDAEPEAATRELVAKIRSGERLETQGYRSSGSSEPPMRVQRTLPTPPTPFVGREVELAELTGLLRDPTCRLLSLVAAGGMGKTRLAVELAVRLEPEFTDGVCFVPFEAVSSPELMVTAVAEALNFAFFGQQDPKEQLFEYLQAKQLLLVVDNLEHLVGGSGLFSELLETAPELTILATSRESLLLQAEWVYDVSGMGSTPATSRTNDAINLFVQTAKRAKTGFELMGQNRDAVTAICQQVGGMPLAIELAASWLRVLTPEAILDEVRKGLEPLDTPLKDMPERHHSVQTVFATSWERLSRAEQAALKRLAVFHGGFDRDAAQRIAEVSLPLLLSLSNKSFLRRDDTGRFTQHPLMWQFGRETAESETYFATTKEKHAVYFAAFLKEREEDHERLHAKRVRQEITTELPNVLAAWEWMVAHKREDLLEQALWSLRDYYRGEYRFHEGEALFMAAQKRLSQDGLIRARLLHTLGLFNNLIGTYDRGARLIRESLELSKKHGALWDEAHARLSWALTQSFSDNVSSEETVALNREAADLFRQAGDVNQEARCLVNIAIHTKHPAERAGLYRRCAAVFRETEHYSGLTLALHNLADMTAYTLGDFREAVSLYDEVLKVERERGRPYIVWWLCGSGNVLTCQGNYSLAKERFEESLTLSRRLNADRGILSPEYALYGLGRLALLQNEYAEADARLHEALALNRASFSPTGTAFTHNALARLAFSRRQFSKARAHCDEVGTLLERAKQHDSEWSENQLLRHHTLADIALARGDMEGAVQPLRAALDVAREWHFLPLQLDLLLSYAEFARQQGDDAQAATLLALITKHKASLFATRQEAEKRLNALPEDARVAGLEQDETLGLEQVVAAILAV